MEIGSREAVHEAVAGGIGIGVVSIAEHVDDKRIACLPFSDVKIYNATHVVCLKGRRDSRIINAFIEAALKNEKRANKSVR